MCVFGSINSSFTRSRESTGIGFAFVVIPVINKSFYILIAIADPGGGGCKGAMPLWPVKHRPQFEHFYIRFILTSMSVILQ